MRNRVIPVTALAFLLLPLLFQSCAGGPSAGQMMMDVAGETFPFRKAGLFSKNHDFWMYEISRVERTGRETSSIGVKGAEAQTTSRGLGFVLKDPAGYEWNIVSLTELKELGRQGTDGMNVYSYTYSARMEEKSTGVARRIRAEYLPSNPDFDGELRGTGSGENNEVYFRFESNVRLDVHDRPDEGLQVFSISTAEGTTAAVLDSRSGFEVTFYEGLVPTQRTQLAATISSLFMLMRYGTL